MRVTVHEADYILSFIPYVIASSILETVNETVLAVRNGVTKNNLCWHSKCLLIHSLCGKPSVSKIARTYICGYNLAACICKVYCEIL